MHLTICRYRRYHSAPRSYSPRTIAMGLLHSRLRNPYVDLLRGFSILVVLFAHFSATCGPFTKPWFVSFEFVRALGRNSCFGVSIFFVISGYLITTSSIQRFGSLGSLNLRDFYIYRASRILPLLLLLTGLNLVCLYVGPASFALTSEISVGRLLAYLYTFRFNILYLHGGAMLSAWSVLWSLAVEEVFYLAYPLLCRCLRRDAIIVAALIAFVIIGPIARLLEGWSGMYRYEGCFDQLALGCLAGLTAQRYAARPRFVRTAPWVMLGGALVTMVCYFCKDAHVDAYWVAGPSAVAMGAAVFALGSAAWRNSLPANPGWQIGHLFRLLGIFSYELYLFHMPLYLLLQPISAAIRSRTDGLLPRDVTFLILLPALIVLGWLFDMYLGRPAQKALRGLAMASALAA
jgi:peptidoglycan/LPS O-acetylase OafA/YrhL